MTYIERKKKNPPSRKSLEIKKYLSLSTKLFSIHNHKDSCKNGKFFFLLSTLGGKTLFLYFHPRWKEERYLSLIEVFMKELYHHSLVHASHAEKQSLPHSPELRWIEPALKFLWAASLHWGDSLGISGTDRDKSFGQFPAFHFCL